MKLFFLLAAAISLSSAADGDYSYDKQESWGDLCSTGKQQSPIEVNEIHRTIYYQDGIETFGGDVAVKRKTENQITVQFDLTDTPVIKMRSGWPVGHTKGLQLLQMHFHWGKPGEGGSEHHLFGKQYAGEVHLVTNNLDQDDDQKDDFLAVFGVFLQASDEEEKINSEVNSNLKQLLAGESTTLNLDKWYNLETKSIFTYEGGLTTPGCIEHVFWQVLEQPITISTEVMTKMRAESTSSYNYREIQEKHGRHITHRLLHQLYSSPEGSSSEETCKVDCWAAKEECRWSGSTAVLPSLVLLLLALTYLM